jgi:hypothetical protein
MTSHGPNTQKKHGRGGRSDKDAQDEKPKQFDLYPIHTYANCGADDLQDHVHMRRLPNTWDTEQAERHQKVHDASKPQNSSYWDLNPEIRLFSTFFKRAKMSKNGWGVVRSLP